MSSETSQLSGSRNVVTNQVINKIATISKTGTNISSFPTSVGVPLLRCVTDGSGFKQNRLYILRADASGYDAVFPAHTHSPTDSFNQGGTMFDVLAANTNHVLDTGILGVKENYGASGEGWEKVGTAAVVNERLSSALYIKGTTGTTATDVFNLFYGRLRLDFSYAFVFTTKFSLSHATAIVFRSGVNPTVVQSAAGGQSQVCIEGCSSSSANLQVRTGNGTTSTILVNTGSSMVISANPTGYKLEYTPGSKVVFTDARGNSITKSDTLPSITQASDGDRTIITGLQSSDATAKVLKLYATRLVGKVYDTASGVSAWL